MTFRASKLRINGKYTEDYDIYIRDRIEVPTPERDVEHVFIRGRNGALTKKYGYSDITLEIAFHMYEDDGDFKRKYRLAKPSILGAKSLMFDDDASVEYRVKNVRINDAYNPTAEFGRFVAEFTLDPFMYEVENEEQAITGRTIVTNEGYESEPIITVHCEGTGELYVNDDAIMIRDINGTITLDSEMMNAYRIDNGYITNLNSHMIGDFPVLKHGDNVIDFDGDISKIELIKNWRWV